MRLFLLLTFCLIIVASAKASNFFTDHATYSDTVSLDSMRLVTIGEISITGNKRTREEIILRELQIKPGDTIRIWKLSENLKKDRNKIYNTRLFNSVEVISTVRDIPIADIQITVEERWYFFPVAILDLADPNFNIWWRQRNRDLNRLEYGLRFTQKNFRGMNEEVRATFQVGFTKRFELMYNMPYIDRNKRNGIRFSGSYSTNKNISYKTTDHELQPFDSDARLRERLKGGIRWMHRPAFYTSYGLEANYNYAQISDTVAKLNPEYFLNGRTSQRYFSLKADFRYDFRDIISYPLKGSIVVFALEKQGLTNYDDINQWEFMADYIKYTPLGSGFYFANEVKGKISLPRIQPYYNLRALGYQKDYVRGYDLNVIEGQSYLLMKNTLRKKLIGGQLNFEKLIGWRQFNKVPFAIYLKSYFDLGYVHNKMSYPENKRFLNTPLPGGGFGVDIVTFYDLVIRVEASMNKEGKSFVFFNLKADIL